jgi:hypothetical protein
MLPKAQAPSRVGLGQPLLLGKFGRRRHRLGLLAPAPTYVPRAWPVTDPRAGDEWSLSPIPTMM